jgi:hypothetical protein
MKKLLAAAALMLLLGLTFGAQAQDDSTKLEDAIASYLGALKDAASEFMKALKAAALPACADLDDANLRASNLDDAVMEGTVYCREIARDGDYVINPGAIGNQHVIERGVLQAYDVFGMTDAGVAVQRFDHSILVCLEGRGAGLRLTAPAADAAVVHQRQLHLRARRLARNRGAGQQLINHRDRRGHRVFLGALCALCG